LLENTVLIGYVRIVCYVEECCVKEELLSLTMQPRLMLGWGAEGGFGEGIQYGEYLPNRNPGKLLGKLIFRLLGGFITHVCIVCTYIRVHM
jgi:hypothetical protein